MMTVIDTANAQQRLASDPRVSAFVAASAGSGKTKLLTDRLLRLMFAGAPPEKILCLTYTKAAAAEMMIRLNRKLGAWVVMPDEKLAAELRALDVPVNVKTLALARKLFADVLDLPGGMRIGTIHAFCQSLLRRFPLEAGLSPHFEVADDEAEALRLREAREAVLAGPEFRDAVAALAAETDEKNFVKLTTDFVRQQSEALRQESPETLAAMQRAALGASEETEAELLRRAVVLPRETQLREGVYQLAELGTPTKGQGWAYRALDWLAMPPQLRAEAWDVWVSICFTKAGTPNALYQFFGKNKKLAAEEDAIRAEIAAECRRVGALNEALKAVRLAALNAQLIKLISPILRRERVEKNLAAHLSYGDLVSFTGQLLIDPGAAWILYKLDGGIDHLLLDEVQDTAPAQWDIADAIADEFFSGQGAREAQRTVFAVGDAKQSIFSFQGANLKSFEQYRAKFGEKVRAAGERWLDGKLSVSFRSTAPVLALVDAVFASGPARAGVCRGDEVIAHQVSRVGQAGSVTLWPLVKNTEAAPLENWAVAEHYAAAESARVILARQIAAEIKTRLTSGVVLPSRGRAATPGDFLILVRRRDALVGAMISALKAEKISVAGQDRMVLTEQLAVSDLLALCDALLLPEDDLAFGQFLVSPLGGLSDESLMALALQRRGSLLAALYRRAGERQDWTQAKAFFEALRTKVDYATPFALLSEALGPLGGRAKLLRRLGAEAGEPVDELLAEALKFAQDSPGALQLFVHQLRQSGASIKREAEAGGDVVRIMTVHGAKGLQAPIVILPDTTALPKPDQKLFWLPLPQEQDLSVPVFCPRTELRAPAVADAADADAKAQGEEYNRLLYVALTRAEDELVVCGAEGGQKLPDACWYESVRAGFARLAEVAQVEGRQVYACAQDAAPDRQARREMAQVATLPTWAGAAPNWVATPLARETTRPERIVPSRGVEDEARRALAASPLGEGLAQLRGARAAAMSRGRAVHALLQHLPDYFAPVERRAAALGYLGRLAELAGQAQKITDAVLTILDAPALAPLFAPGSQAEVPLAGVVGEVEIGGLVDRLAVSASEVWIADYKTDRAPPADVAGIPEGYLRQLAAYRAILAQIYPGRRMICLLVWTETAQAMQVPPALLDAHEPA
ncbi:MAG: double-strand break repair helicase AddA [Acidocella sp. 20-63-7]|nr:MAG: double-strand break repair helicase AddA [Acidocella sp. 20-63-7]